MSQWDGLVQQAAQRWNVDPKLIASVIQVESSGNANAVSEVGAVGLGQHMPTTAKSLGIDPKDPAQSIDGIAKLLDENLRRYGSPEQAILAYHGGTDQANWGPKTQDYLRKISGQYGATEVAKTSPKDDEFEASFGARPQSASAPAPVGDSFEASFGPRPPAAQAAQVGATAAEQPVAVANVQPVDEQPGLLSRGADMAWNGLQALGEQGLKNANAVGRGISDAFDAPSEWLASGAEASGLTGLLAKGGINMPTTEQQKAINAQSRADYDARNPDSGISEFLGRMGGNAIGVMVPVAGVEAGLTQGAGKLSAALGNPESLAAAGRFLTGQGGLASKTAYSAAQGGAGGAILSGGQPGTDTGDQAALGAALGALVPGAAGAVRYAGNAGRALTAPFTASGRAGIAERAIQAEAAKDPLNMAQGVITPRGQGAPGQSPVQIAGGTADDALGRAGAGGRIEANFDEIVPGSVPTLAQATGNAGVAALERAAMSRAPNQFAERQLSNYAARNAYLGEIKGTPETLSAAIAQRDAQALPYLRDALQNARPANANPVVSEIDSILSGRAGQRDEVVKALSRVKDKLDLGEGQGVQSSVEQLYGIRQSINDQLATVAGRDNSAAQLASKELIQVRDKLDDSIQAAAPGFKEFLKTYSELSRPVDAQRYLQGLDLTDQTSQRITLNKVKNALTRIDKQRAAPGANEAKSISDDQLAMLRNLQADLQREAHSSRGMSIGSNTFQNFATNQLIDSMLPGKAGAIAPVTPSALGGALGYALGGNLGAGIGAVGAQQAAGIAGRAMNAQGPEIEARLIDYLLNPRGAEVLKKGSVNPGPLDVLLRRGGSTPASAINSGSSGSSNNR